MVEVREKSKRCELRSSLRLDLVAQISQALPQVLKNLVTGEVVNDARKDPHSEHPKTRAVR